MIQIDHCILISEIAAFFQSRERYVKPFSFQINRVRRELYPLTQVRIQFKLPHSKKENLISLLKLCKQYVSPEHISPFQFWEQLQQKFLALVLEEIDFINENCVDKGEQFKF